MSLILEALKKSERQRRLGESPSLGSPIMAVRRRRSLLPVIIVLIVIGLLALWWLRRGTEAPTAPVATKSAPANPKSPPMADATSFKQVPAPASVPLQAPAAKIVRDSPVKAARDIEGDRRNKVRDGVLVTANPQAGPAATVKESEPVSAADSAALASAMANEQAPVAVPIKAAPGKTANPAEGAPAAGSKSPKADVAAAPPATAKVDGTALKLMWELPLATRSKLPEIKLSMHVFAADPAQRFAIINDDRHVEGDDVNGMKLLEIRTDGVVFEFDNVRFLYPRGGR